MLSNLKIFLLVIIISIFSMSCSSVKNAFDPKRKNSSEEFLVEKKSPLSIPPDFEKLPVPKSEEKEQEKIDEIQTLLEKTNKNSGESNENKDTELDELILEKIINN